MSDTPETDLEDDLYLECASPRIVKESTGAIFVIVHVSYDYYYRVQDNLGAATDFETAKAIAARESVERGSPSDALPIIEIAEESFDMDFPETRHIWIEVFSQNHRGIPR